MQRPKRRTEWPECAGSPSAASREISRTVKLTKAAADGLNQAFGTTAFAEDLTIGTATVTAKAA